MHRNWSGREMKGKTKTLLMLLRRWRRKRENDKLRLNKNGDHQRQRWHRVLMSVSVMYQIGKHKRLSTKKEKCPLYIRMRPFPHTHNRIWYQVNAELLTLMDSSFEYFRWAVFIFPYSGFSAIFITVDLVEKRFSLLFDGCRCNWDTMKREQKKNRINHWDPKLC